MAVAREGSRGEARAMKDRGQAGCIVMMGRRQVTPRWLDDPVRRHYGRWWWRCQGDRGLPPMEGHQKAGIEGRRVK